MLRWTVHQKGGPNRLFHAAVAVEDKVYSFGGYNLNDSDQIEVHIFNTVSFRWVQMPTVRNGRERSLEVPSLRYYHTAVLIEHVIYIWGGFKFSEGYCNMVYAFDVGSHRWFKPIVYGTLPEARSGHSACVKGNSMYIFGGHNWRNQWTNGIHKLDTTTMVWSVITKRTSPAHISDWHSSTIIGTKMFVFGGRGNRGKYNNIRVFDTETNRWSRTPSKQFHPIGRVGHSAFAYNGELYIFGGHDMETIFKDLWKFNPMTTSWTKVEPKGEIPLLSSMCSCMVGDRIIHFVDYKGDKDGNEEDDSLYILDLSPSLKTLCKLTVIQHRLEKSGLPHDISWELAAMTTNGT